MWTAVVPEPDPVRGVAVPFPKVFPGNSDGFRTSIIGSSDGYVEVAGTGGTAPYTFLMVGNGAERQNVASAQFSGLTAGTYQVQVTDSRGCPPSTAGYVVHTPGIPYQMAAPVLRILFSLTK